MLGYVCSSTCGLIIPKLFVLGVYIPTLIVIEVFPDILKVLVVDILST